MAYGVATSAAAIATYLTCRAHFPLKFEGRTATALLGALLLLATVMIAANMLNFGWGRLLVTAAASAIWLVWSLTDEGAREMLAKLKRRRAAQ